MKKKQAPLIWLDEWKCVNTMKYGKAVEVLKDFYNAWPCGIVEVDASIAGHKRIIALLEKELHEVHGYSQEQLNHIKCG